METEKTSRARREHCLNIYVSYELKEKLRGLSEKYDRTLADIIRAVLKIGIPMMEGISEAEETMVKEYIKMFRRLRKLREIKEI
jgi:predicted DNA-binding protein